LFREHWPRAHRAAFLVVQDAAAAEDIAQEAVPGRDPQPRSLRPAAVRSGRGCTRIVVNRAIDWARARALRRELAEVPGSEDFDTGDLGTFSEGVAAGLASLPPDQRAVIVLRYLLEYTPGEIAEMLEVPRGTVNSRLRRGLDRLETIVDREQR
jgi:RNA polymerase sigma-70 factor (ECF subfamily)